MIQKLLLCSCCKKIKICPYTITDLVKDAVYKGCLCSSCGDYVFEKGEFPEYENIVEQDDEFDLTEIKTPDQLIGLILGDEILGPILKDPCPKCGLTVEEFDQHGRFGCQFCYKHFHEAMEHMVYPYHGAKKHVGKIPKNNKGDLEEKIKVLKLKKSHAIEHEKYEEAAQFREEIEQLKRKIK